VNGEERVREGVTGVVAVDVLGPLVGFAAAVRGDGALAGRGAGRANNWGGEAEGSMAVTEGDGGGSEEREGDGREDREEDLAAGALGDTRLVGPVAVEEEEVLGKSGGGCLETEEVEVDEDKGRELTIAGAIISEAAGTITLTPVAIEEEISAATLVLLLLLLLLFPQSILARASSIRAASSSS
jgi:hypothetical protein